MYRTGDLGRWRADGLLECLGRTDFQVKVRGFRIELGEIEVMLATHPAVRQAVVNVWEVGPGDKRLAAYVVLEAGAELGRAEMQEFLRRQLPAYMVPSEYVVLAKIPLSPNGKVDRKALPAPAQRPSTEPGTAPRTELEEAILVAFCELLGVSEIGIYDSFFDLGGHSLLVAQLASRLGRRFGMELPMRVVFERPTVAEVAEWIDAKAGAAQKTDLGVIPHRADQSAAPLSLMQQRLWFLEELQPGGLTYDLPWAQGLLGPLDETAFERALNEVVRRQSALRTTICVQDGVPVQEVQSELVVALLPVEDLSSLPPEARRSALHQRLSELVSEPIDFRTAPAFRARLFRLGPEEHVFFFMVHHIVWDGWSFDLFGQEMAVLYQAYRQGQSSPLAPVPITYGDFAAWHRGWLQGEELARQLDYWKEALSGYLEPLQLPGDFPRPPVMSGSGGGERLTIAEHTTNALRELVQVADATLFMNLLAAYYVLLARMSGQTDLVVGTPVWGRNRTETEKVMGLFVNTLALRRQVDMRQPFIAFLGEVRELVLSAFGCPDAPFEELVRALRLPRDESRSPLFQAICAFQSVGERGTPWGNLIREDVPMFAPGVANDIGLWLMERPETVAGFLSYNADIFSPETAQRFCDRYLTLLDSIVADPHRPIGQLDMVPARERAELVDWAVCVAPYDRDALLQSLFEAQAERAPQRIAIRCGEQQVSYAELEARANRLAHALRCRGVGRGMLVGLCLERSVDMVAAVLAVLKAGAGYVPLDPAFPVDRLEFMIEDSGLALVVSQSELAACHGCPAERTLDLDTAADEPDRDSRLASDEQAARAEDVAYVLYTSGSTGRPKGVRVSHRAAINFLTSMQREPGLGPDDRLLAVTTLSFDIALLELMLPLSMGAQVVLASRDDALDGVALQQLLERGQVTVMQATPATWRLLIESGWRGHPGFKALCGGEALSLDLAESLLARVGELWNMYGPTETTVWSTCWRVTQPRQGICIGRPIANTSIWILDPQHQLCPIGVPGEIHIGGDGVALGYLNRPDLTSERFIADPFSSTPGARMYRTGDLGRWRADGLLECLGRTDFQVKVRGFRIELGEIEAVLMDESRVRQAVVTVHTDALGDTRIVAYVVYELGQARTGSEMRRRLASKLPDYMLPHIFVELETLPLTANGKVDRRALPPPFAQNALAGEEHIEPRTEVERVIAALWCELLKVERVSVRDNFFALGGHSLLSAQMVAQLCKRTGHRLSLRSVIFETLEQLAANCGPAAQPAGPT
jgi:amino acid adenylation domain-containing protein